MRDENRCGDANFSGGEMILTGHFFAVGSPGSPSSSILAPVRENFKMQPLRVKICIEGRKKAVFMVIQFQQIIVLNKPSFSLLSPLKMSLNQISPLGAW